jgi:hypothetical protein
MITLETFTLFSRPAVMLTFPDWKFVTLAVVMLASVMAALVTVMFANVSTPLDMPFTAFARTLKLASSCDSGIDAVALAKVLGMVTGSAI